MAAPANGGLPNPLLAAQVVRLQVQVRNLQRMLRKACGGSHGVRSRYRSPGSYTGT
jgi:hypothetical protein